MAVNEKQAIRFLRPWHGRNIGEQVSTQLDWGVKATLVGRRVAEWVQDQSPVDQIREPSEIRQPKSKDKR